MTIVTKYNVGDEVWFIARIHGKIRNEKISYIRTKTWYDQKSVEYLFGDDTVLDYSESELFPNKQELLESL